MKQNIARLVAVATAALAVVGPLAGPASAAKRATTSLSFFQGGAGTAGWVKDGGESMVKLDNPGPLYDSWAGIELHRSSVETISGLQSAAFDAKGYVGAGSIGFRFALDNTGDGVTDLYLYGSNGYCSGADASTWTTYDFQSDDCTLWYGGTPYTWTALEAAHGSDTIVGAFVIQDEVGTAYVDHIQYDGQTFDGPSGNRR